MTFTSSFGKASAIKKADPDAVLVAVCGKLPAGFNHMPCLQCAAPKWSWWSEWHSMFKDNLESVESRVWYAQKYKTDVLDKLDKAGVLDQLKQFAPDGQNVYLLCYEPAGKFCHRSLLASWLNEGMPNGQKIVEWTA